jgi:hypothetical protein
MIRWLSFLAAAAVLAAGFATAEENSGIESDYEAKENNWRVIVSPYALLAGMSTDVGGEKIRTNFNDLSSLTNFGFQLNTNVMYKKWVFTADGTYANLGSSSDQGLVRVDADIKQYMMDLRLGYLVHTDVDQGDDTRVVRGWALEVNAGAKFWQNDLSVGYALVIDQDPPLLEGNLKTVQKWWDPMLGVKARIILSRTVLLGLSASGGGFGVADASDYSWDFVYTNSFKVSRLLTVTAGFRSFLYKRTDGEGPEEVQTKVAVNGPLIGVSFVF